MQGSAAAAGYLPFCGVAALVIAAPFERHEPWLHSGWQNVTNVEVVIVAAVAVWLAGVRARGVLPEWRTPLTLPWVALLITLLVSALAAPAYTGNALRLVGRLGIALVIVLMTADVVTSGARLLALMTLATISGAAVAALAVLEYAQFAPVIEWLKVFRPGLHVVGGHLRATSTLQYPTITSMYLEIAFALGLGLLVTAIDRRRAAAAALVFAGLVVIAEGIIVTFTRAGVVTVYAVLMTVAFFSARGAPPPRAVPRSHLAHCAGPHPRAAQGCRSARPQALFRYRRHGVEHAMKAIGALAVLIAALAAFSYGDESLRLRLTTEADQGWYRAEYRVPNRLTLTPGGLSRVDVTVTNTGRVTWYPDHEPPFRLAYHWLEEAADRVVQYDGLRTEFPAPVAPGASVTVRADVQAPPVPGVYRLAWDVVHEQRLWFSTENSPSAYSRVIVSGPPAGGRLPPARRLPVPNFRIGRRALWRVAAQMLAAHPLVGVGPDNFRLLYGDYAGFSRFDRRIHTNSMYLELLVGGGLIGGAAFLWLLWEARRPLRDAARRIDEAYRWAFLGVSAALAAVLLHGLVDTFLAFTPTYLMISLTLGLLLACARSLGADSNAHRV